VFASKESRTGYARSVPDRGRGQMPAARPADRRPCRQRLVGLPASRRHQPATAAANCCRTPL